MRNYYENEKGATTLETAITILPFLLFLFGIIQLCLVAYTAFTLQFSVNNCARWGIVDGATYAEIQTLLQQELSTYQINTSSLQVNLCQGIVSNCNLQEEGSSNSFITLQATVNAPSVMGWNFPVTGKVVAKNEPF